MTSLRDKLKNLVLSKGQISYGEVCQFVAEEGYKVSTAERRLRGLCSSHDEQKRPQVPEIRPVMKKSKRNTDYIAAWERVTQKVYIKEYPKFEPENIPITQFKVYLPPNMEKVIFINSMNPKKEIKPKAEAEKGNRLF